MEKKKAIEKIRKMKKIKSAEKIVKKRTQKKTAAVRIRKIQAR